MGRILAIDYGEKRIGLALSDISKFLASPFRTIQNTGFKAVVKELKNIIDEQNVEGIVVGLPVTMKGSKSQKTEEVEAWIEKIKAQITIPVDTMDERLTTIQAHQIIHAKGQKVGKKRDVVDQYSAAILLQAYLDKRKTGY